MVGRLGYTIASAAEICFNTRLDDHIRFNTGFSNMFFPREVFHWHFLAAFGLFHRPWFPSRSSCDVSSSTNSARGVRYHLQTVQLQDTSCY